MAGLRLQPRATGSGLPDIDVPPGSSKTVGRGGQADITIDDPSLSRLHARVTAEPDGLLAIDDLGSTNGVVINEREQLSSYLRAGDIVRFGRVEYVVTSVE
jgi:pSer/pThr/pTyr-binding forkhead associated (FHA) protein